MKISKEDIMKIYKYYVNKKKRKKSKKIKARKEINNFFLLFLYVLKEKIFQYDLLKYIR